MMAGPTPRTKHAHLRLMLDRALAQGLPDFLHVRGSSRNRIAPPACCGDAFVQAENEGANAIVRNSHDRKEKDRACGFEARRGIHRLCNGRGGRPGWPRGKCAKRPVPTAGSVGDAIAYCAGWGGTTSQPPSVPLTRMAVADWMDVSAAIFGKALIDSGVRAQSGMPSTS